MDDSFFIPSQWIVPLIMVGAAAILIAIAIRLLTVMKRNPRTVASDAALRISLECIPRRVISAGSPRIEVLNVSAQLPIVVVAPVGRSKKLPHAKLLPQILDRAIPGLREVLLAHETQVLAWPAQMSTTGFRERFFYQVNLPGERGKGTEWSAVAGCFATTGHRFALGLVLRSDQPNNLGQLPIDKDAQWLGRGSGAHIMSVESTDATDDRSSDDAIREALLAIWHASVDAVRAESLIDRAVELIDDTLCVHGHDGQTHSLDLARFRRVCIVGGGKAAGGMAAALESKLVPQFDQPGQLLGWVNIPNGAATPSRCLTMHEARQLGVNEPTVAANQGTNRILELVGSLRPEDLCIVVLTGGGSALLPAPAKGLSLADKIEVTRCLSAAGADIVELNAVRRQLSQVKGGRLAAACGAGHVLTLVISDVMSDDLASIASGPTFVSDDGDAAFVALQKYDPLRENISQVVWEIIENNRSQPAVRISVPVEHVLLANNQTAVMAASSEAARRGFQVETMPADVAQPTANALGQQLADRYRRVSEHNKSGRSGGRLIVSGGEPTVQLVPTTERGLGGRNQQAVLAAIIELAKSDTVPHGAWILSGGTDGEDGPTDAAGAIAGPQQIAQVRQDLPSAIQALAANDAYPLLDRIGAIFKTGLTGTNVCDVQLVLSSRNN